MPLKLLESLKSRFRGGPPVFLNQKMIYAAIYSFGILTFAAACSREDKKSSAQSAGDKSAFGNGAGDPGAGAEGTKELQFKRNAMRNFEELKFSMAAVMCIKDEDKVEANSGRTFGKFFRDVSGNLPTTNDVEKYIAANIVATMNLASHACLLSISLPSASACKWSAGLRDANNPQTAFSDVNLNNFGRSIYQNIWGLDSSQIPDSSQFLADIRSEVGELKKKIQEQLVTANVPAVQQPRKIVEGVLISLCSAALSAPPFTTY